jgi:hypothetical protein
MTGNGPARDAAVDGYAAAAPRLEQVNVAAVDPGKLIEMALRVWGYKQGEVVSLMIHLGDRLGLYQALRGVGPVTSGQLAARTGLQERWLCRAP